MSEPGRLRARRGQPARGRRRGRGAGRAAAAGSIPAAPRGWSPSRATTRASCGSTSAPGSRSAPTASGRRWSSPSGSGRFDTIGIDCVAMNVNDLICVGAEPIAMLDFILCSRRRPRGLRRRSAPACAAGPSWPASRSRAARSRRWATSSRAGSSAAARSASSPLDEIVTGAAIEPGDALIGIPSSGLHSNGYTLARSGARRGPARRRAPRAAARRRAARADRDLRARRARAAATRGADVRGLAHITGDGLNNLLRLSDRTSATRSTPRCRSRTSSASIQELGDVSDDEMHEVFNMGLGFVCVVAAGDARRGRRDASAPPSAARARIGAVTDDAGSVVRP